VSIDRYAQFFGYGISGDLGTGKQIKNVQRLLATAARPDTVAWHRCASPSGLWHPAEPDESAHLHDLRAFFADLRGYTALSQSLPEDQIAGLLDVFYDECASAIWDYDGLLNKTIGDAIMAIFNFPIRNPDHAARAIDAGREIQRRCTPGKARPSGPWTAAASQSASGSESTAVWSVLASSADPTAI
jgi:class 3 adenylate cyclase